MLRYLCSALAVLLLMCTLEVRVCAQIDAKISEPPAHNIADMKPKFPPKPGEPTLKPKGNDVVKSSPHASHPANKWGADKNGFATHHTQVDGDNSKALPGTSNLTSSFKQSIHDPLYGKLAEAIQSDKSSPVDFHIDFSKMHIDLSEMKEEHEHNDPDPPCNKYFGAARKQCEEQQHNVRWIKPGQSLTICCNPSVVPQNPKSK
jgi:hypothetical protein